MEPMIKKVKNIKILKWITCLVILIGMIVFNIVGLNSETDLTLMIPINLISVLFIYLLLPNKKAK